MHLDLRVRMLLEALDEEQIDRVIRATNSSSGGSSSSRSSCINAQRRDDATITSVAPAFRCRQEILAGTIDIELVMGVLDRDTVRPRATSSGIIPVNSVVLPLPLHPQGRRCAFSHP